MNKALFLDRDGIVNIDKSYVYKKEDIEFVDGIFTLCKAAVEKGYMIIIITNQSGIARGYFTEEDVKILHKWMADEFLKRGIKITDIFYCPYHEKGTVEKYAKKSDCRKPAPGMILEAAKKYDIDIKSSVIVGDKESDRIKLDGLKSIIVKSRYVPENYDAKNLYDVIEMI